MLLLGRPTREADCARSSVPARSDRRLSETLQPRQNFRQRIWYVSMLELYYHTAPALSSGPGHFSLTMQCGFGMGPRCRGGWRICPEPGCTSRRGRMVPLVVGATISRPKPGAIRSRLRRLGGVQGSKTVSGMPISRRTAQVASASLVRDKPHSETASP